MMQCHAPPFIRLQAPPSSCRAPSHHSSSRCSSSSRCIQLYSAHRRLQAVASAYTQESLTAVRLAQQEAIRQGSMFVAPPHLLLGLLDVKPACTARQLLESAGLSAAAAEDALMDKELIPQSRTMSPGDLDFAPDARLALKLAAEAARDAGLSAASTPHLLLGLVTCSNRTVAKLLDSAGISTTVFAVQIRNAAKSCSEPSASQPASAADQQADLISYYQRYVQQHGTAPPQRGPAPTQGLVSAAGEGMTPEDDDIYN